MSANIYCNLKFRVIINEINSLNG